MIKENQLEISIKAPYYTLNEFTEDTERIWLSFHGYGQLAKYFLKKFQLLDPKKNFIIAPQGLSKYYLDGFYGRVGASWMTKEDRLTEIENQYRYIQTVLDEIGDISSKELIYFGFSQGTATMGRFAAWSKIDFTKMVIWAGTFPPDIEPNAFNFLSGSEEITYFTSREDPFFKEEMIENQNKVVAEATGRTPNLQWYDGGHTVVPELLLNI
ncbi:MAG: alpha/beta hydrolase [Cyclobacteriaceae bacterium]